MKNLAKDLIKQGIITDKSWLDTGLRASLERSMVHLVNAGKEYFSKAPNNFETYGCDFLLDTNLNVWFMECQSDPNYGNSSSNKLARSQFEIVVGLFKSRLKRFVEFVNDLTKEVKKKGKKGINKLMRKRQKDYEKINANYFEDEYLPGKKNSLVKIIDESLDGKERYGNLFPDECLDVLSK